MQHAKLQCSACELLIYVPAAAVGTAPQLKHCMKCKKKMILITMDAPPEEVAAHSAEVARRLQEITSRVEANIASRPKQKPVCGRCTNFLCRRHLFEENVAGVSVYQRGKIDALIMRFEHTIHCPHCKAVITVKAALHDRGCTCSVGPISGGSKGAVGRLSVQHCSTRKEWDEYEAERKKDRSKLPWWKRIFG